MTVPAQNTMREALEWDAAAAPTPGETALGDRSVVAFAGDRALAAAVDGLGHGVEAGAAAQEAASALERSACRDIAERILHQYAVGSDDALVLVAGYLASR